MAPVPSIEQLMNCLRRLPGIGPKTAERLAFHLLSAPEEEARSLSEAILAARRGVKVCSSCCNLDQEDPCRICADRDRDRGFLLVVEDPRDVGRFEETGHRGLYHVLQGRISQSEGIAPEDLTADLLLERVRAGALREVCLATNPDLEGEATASWLGDLLRPTGVAVTRLARGLPSGASVRMVSGSILTDAIEGRRPL